MEPFIDNPEIDEAIEDGMQNMYLTFMVGEEIYGVEIRYVLQIIGMQSIAQMPDMPSYMKGYIDLRGKIIPVVSMRLRFGKPEIDYHDRNCIIVVNIGEKYIGLIVDSIRETLSIEPERISEQPSTGSQPVNTFITGVARIGSKEVTTAVIIDIQRLFDPNSF